MVSFILPGNSASDSDLVTNSCRFNKASSDHLSITPSSAGSLQKYTFSCWVKRSTLGANASLFGARVDANTNFFITFRDDDDLYIKNKIGGTTKTLITNRVFRDPSAWLNVVVAMDTTQGTASNRTKIYINGVQETSFSTEEYPAQNGNTAVNQTVEHNIGDDVSDSGFFNGYIAEAVFINNAQLAPTSFGEFDSDSEIWKPIDVSGLTFGTNGFYLQFKQSGTSQNSSGLGADTSGNDHHFAVNNLTSVDQSIDTCINNFATLNPLNRRLTSNDPTYSEGNLKLTGQTANGQNNNAIATIQHLTSGKWYFECKATLAANGNFGIGISDNPVGTNGNAASDSYYLYYDKGGSIVYGTGSSASTASYGNSYTDGDIIGVAFDLDNGNIYFYKNGTIQNSGTAARTDLVTQMVEGYTPIGFNNKGAMEFNFGSPSFAISSGNADDNGYGNFEYAVPSGYYTINTKNLAEYG